MIHGACRNTRHVSLTANAVLALKPAHGLLEKIWHDCVSECIDENTPTYRGVRDFGYLMLYLEDLKPRSDLYTYTRFVPRQPDPIAVVRQKKTAFMKACCQI